MKQKLSALDKIYDCLLNGGQFGQYIEFSGRPHWWPTLFMVGPVAGRFMLLGRKRGEESEAFRCAKKWLRTALRTYFKCKPSVFLTAYQCRFG